MQHAGGKAPADAQNPKSEDDLSQYLRQGPVSDVELRKISSHRPGRAVGHMNNIGTTLIVGKLKNLGSGDTGSQYRNFSESVSHTTVPTLSHLKSASGTWQNSKANDPLTGSAAGPARNVGSIKSVSMFSSDPIQLTVWFHEPASYSHDVVVESSTIAGLRVGEIYELQPIKKEPDNPNIGITGKPGTTGTSGKSGKNAIAQKLVFIIRDDNVVTKSPAPVVSGSKAKGGFQISLTSALQKPLDIPPRSSVQVRAVTDMQSVELDTLEIYIKDVNFSRDSQWNLSSSLVGTCCYVGQRVSFMGSRIGYTKCLFKDGRKRFSGYIGNSTSIVFRSESAKLVFLVQLSSEMWHFEENGEVMFHKLVNTLFPMIFKKWRLNNAHHAITIVLFTTVDFTRAPWITLGGGERPSHCQDYYRVVVDQVSVFIWDKIMANLRLEFANFKRDILLHLEGNEYKIKGEPCPSVKGNLLEAINLSLTLVSDMFRNTDLRHTINHLVVVTPGTGLFDVDYTFMLETSKKMFSLHYALEIVCLSQPPLHTVPLFRYRSERGDVCHCVPKWCDMSFYGAATATSMAKTGRLSAQWIPRCKIYELQMMGLMENEMSDVQIARVELGEHVPVAEAMDDYDEGVFSPVKRKPLVAKVRLENDAQGEEKCFAQGSIQHHKHLNRHSNNHSNAVTLSLMRSAGAAAENRPGTRTATKIGTKIGVEKPGSAQTAATNVCTTNSSVHGLVTHLPMASSALSALYTLNKTGNLQEPTSAKSTNSIKSIKSGRSGRDSMGHANERSQFAGTAVPMNLLRLSTASRNLHKKQASGAFREENKRRSACELEELEREQNNSYWIPVANPSEPHRTLAAASCSRWAEVFPRKIQRRMFKWRSLKAPAALPIATTLFPTSAQMDAEYTFHIYVVSLNWENRLDLASTKDLMQEMVRLRLAQGFQVCYGDRVKKFEAGRKSGGYPDGIVKYLPTGDCVGARIYLSLNDEIHRIFLDYSGALNVQLYKKVHSEDTPKVFLGTASNTKKKPVPLIRTRYAEEFTPCTTSGTNPQMQYFNWNQLDQFLAGYEDSIPQISRHFRQMKFVVMPGPMSANAYHISNEKLSEEEIRLEGLRKLIALIERGRYKAGDNTSTKIDEEMFQEIKFYTGNLHDYLHDQAESFETCGTKPANSLLFTDGLRFNTNIKLSRLAQELQTQDGLKLVDRAWHFKVHPHCFLGSDLVSWLIKLFDDIDSRDVATEFGQSLMDKNVISHVENRHGFLDGHYFYEFCEEYVDQSYRVEKKDDKKGWFQKKQPLQKAEDSKDSKEGKVTKDAKDAKDGKTSGSSEPNTPLSAPAIAPTLTRSNSRSSMADTPGELKKVMSQDLFQESGSGSSLSEPKAKKRKKFLISKHVKYNCDPSGKSFRPELLDVHYDTVHNPEHCFHIRLQWLNTTTKLIDDAVINWSRFCERYGLKLVETPWTELCTVPEFNPFHSFVDLKLAVNPFLDPEFSGAEILLTNRFYFHLHFLKVTDFLLENRSTSFFLKEHTEICYSWGVPSFKYAQFVHKSGAYIVELRENGEFCMAPNNMHILRMNTFVSPSSDQSGRNSILDSQQVMLKFRDCCRDVAFLRQLFRDASKFLHDDFDAAYVIGV